MNGTLDSAIRPHFSFFTLPLADVDDSGRNTIVDLSRRRNDLLNGDVHMGTANEMAGALRSDDTTHDIGSSRNENGTAVTGGAYVVGQREQHRIIVLNSGRIQCFIENDRKDGPLR